MAWIEFAELERVESSTQFYAVPQARFGGMRSGVINTSEFLVSAPKSLIT